jgi:hypothetical protein
MLGGGPVSWDARKQKTVALSSTEAEYMGLAEATKEATYLRSFLIAHTEKTVYMVNKSPPRVHHWDIRLLIGNAPIRKVNTYKYLGTIVDPKLTFESNAAYAVKKPRVGIMGLRRKLAYLHTAREHGLTDTHDKNQEKVQLRPWHDRSIPYTKLLLSFRRRGWTVSWVVTGGSRDRKSKLFKGAT